MANLRHKSVFTTGEAAEICGLSQQTIIRCFDSGQLGGFRVPGSKFRRIPRDKLIKFMRDHDIPLSPLESDKIKVLVVDDDPTIVEMFVDALGTQIPLLHIFQANAKINNGESGRELIPSRTLLKRRGNCEPGFVEVSEQEQRDTTNPTTHVID